MPQTKILAAAALGLIPAAVLGQTAPPRTPWGAPDLRGVWSHGTATPLERPERYGERDRLTEAEVAEVDAAQRSAEGVGARRVVWWERSLSDGRTSMIVDPTDGRIPYSAAGRARREARPGQTTAGPEGRSPQERCISYGIPRLGGPYSQNVHIAQTPDHVLLLHEMVHEFRVIPLDGRPHVPGHVRQWLGDSRGRWEGDTLVVETTHFRDAQWFQGLSQGGDAPRRTLHAPRRRHGALRGDVRGPGPVDAALDGGDSDAAHRRGDVRVRLPRGEHGHDGDARDRPGGGGRGERFAVVRGSRCGPFALRVTPRVT